jgi:IPT/TIG domain
MSTAIAGSAAVPVTDPQSLGPNAATRFFLGAYLVAGLLMLAYLLACLWPAVLLTEAASTRPVTIFGREVAKLDAELALLWAVGVLGALGGTLHAVGSFVNYIGNRTFVRSWTWFYIARGPVGFGLALLFYFALRGGIVSVSTATSSTLNPYGVGAIAALAGLFSEIATLKMREVFTALFRPEDDRKNPLSDAAPSVGPIEPSSADAGAPETSIIVSGTNFEATDGVTVDNEPVATTFVSATELRARIPAAKLAKPAKLEVVVRRTGPKGVTSRPVTFEVKAVSSDS